MPFGRLGERLAACANILAVAAGLLWGAPAARGGEPVITPHHAVYRVSLVPTATRSITQASGRIEFDWRETCDGWLVDQKTHLILTSMEGQTLESGWTLKAWESKDGLSYRFSVRRVFDDNEPTQTKGKARLEGPGLHGLVSFTAPERSRLDLPQGTVFPIWHSLELIKAGVRSEPFFWRLVFDGAGPDGLFGVNAAFTEALATGQAPSFDSPLIGGVPSWRMRLAYFDTETEAVEPKQEQVQRLYANGVVDELEFHYEDFALRATLEALEALPRPDCS